jgi:hypothetical protein
MCHLHQDLLDTHSAICCMSFSLPGSMIRMCHLSGSITSCLSVACQQHHRTRELGHRRAIVHNVQPLRTIHILLFGDAQFVTH